MADGRRPQSLTNRPVAKFLTSLYAMVDEGDSEIIGWDATGTRFVVKDVKRLEAEVLGKYFRTSKFSSTCRQVRQAPQHGGTRCGQAHPCRGVPISRGGSVAKRRVSEAGALSGPRRRHATRRRARR